MLRTYVIASPTAPMEPEGARTLPGNVVRTVSYADGVKTVTWDYRDATF